MDWTTETRAKMGYVFVLFFTNILCLNKMAENMAEKRRSGLLKLFQALKIIKTFFNFYS